MSEKILYVDKVFNPPSYPTDYYHPVLLKIASVLQKKLRYFFLPYTAIVNDLIMFSTRSYGKVVGSYINVADFLCVTEPKKENEELWFQVLPANTTNRSNLLFCADNSLVLMPLIIYNKDAVKIDGNTVKTEYAGRPVYAKLLNSISTNNADAVKIYVSYSDDKQLRGFAVLTNIENITSLGEYAVIVERVINNFARIEFRDYSRPRRKIWYMPVKDNKIVFSAGASKIANLAKVLPYIKNKYTVVDSDVVVYGRNKRIVGWKNIAPPVYNCPTCDSKTTEEYRWAGSYILVDYSLEDRTCKAVSVTYK